MVKANLTQGHILKQLISLALPMAFGVFAIIGFNLVDTFFVARLGNTELAAITFTFPFPLLIGSVAFGIGAAVSSFVSRALGAGDYKVVKAFTTDSLLLGVILALIISFIGILTIDPIFRALGAGEDTLPHIKSYMNIWYFNLPFIVIPMIGNNAIRAMGNTRFPAMVMAVAGLVNALLDPLLIFGLLGFPKLGLQGAAIATVISRIFTLMASIYVLHFKYQVLINPFTRFRETLSNWKAIAALAFPAFLTNLVNPIAMAVVTKMVSRYGSDVVAGFGVGSKIESFLAILIIGLAASLGPFVGQNYGAKNFERIKEALKIANLFPVIWGTLMFITMYFFSENLSALFNDKPEVIAASRNYLLIISFGLVGYGLLHNAVAVFNVLGKPKISLMINIFKMILVYLPFAFILKGSFHQQGIYVAVLLSHLFAGSLIYFLLMKEVSKCQS